MPSITLRIAEMKCEGCASAVESALTSVPGVRAADVSLDEKRATIDLDDMVDVEDLISAVKAAGYDASLAA